MSSKCNSNGDIKQLLYRNEGVTAEERFLLRLCNHTFLTLWSYAGIYRDQKDGSTNARDGKEVCDLLVVFENHIIIFSDKACEFPNTGNLELDWSRWYKRAILKSAEQIWGAERWIKEHPDRLFLDRACTKKFPIILPEPSNMVIHRIVVSHGCSERCKQVHGGSGSLMIMPHRIGDDHYKRTSKGILPFAVGQIDSSRGYVHVLDDTTLEIVMKNIDTITDFVKYLEKKEQFIASGRLLSAAGEEELVAEYMSKINSNGEHDFIYPSEADAITLMEGFWDNYIHSSEYKAKVKCCSRRIMSVA